MNAVATLQEKPRRCALAIEHKVFPEEVRQLLHGKSRTPIHYLKLLNIWRISKCRNPYFFVKCFAL